MHATRYLQSARIRWASRGGSAAVMVALTAVLTTVLIATIASPVTPASAASSRMLCRRYQHVPVQAVQAGQAGQQSRYMVRNDFWGTGAMCMFNSGQQPNFRLVSAGRNQLNGAVMAFPYIFTGCSWGICTPGSGLPARVLTLKDPRSSWAIAAKAGGMWDASYDLWFSRHRITNGQATGAELMIWLKSRRIGPFSHRIVRVDGARWYFTTWMTPRRAGLSWRYIQFRRVHPTSKVTNLDLGAFIRRAEHMRVTRHGRPLIQRRWWLMNMEAGFELHHGGRGLATRSFSAHL